MTETRKFWLCEMQRVARPVLDAAASGELRARLPVKHHPASLDREEYTYLEALGRTLCGIAPWLETPAEDAEEESLRREAAELARRAIAAAVTPSSPDVMNFSRGYQPIVDAAFLAEGILRAPRELYEKLPDSVRRELIARMKETRTRKPYATNWLLFAAMTETFLRFAGEADWDPMRVDYALRQHMQWYKGDAVYGDGADLHFDYYNSFVIQPMLTDILRHAGDAFDWRNMREKVYARAARYASELEQLISPEGTYPVIGRSVCYRYGAFHALANAALLGMLEPETTPAQVRCAMTAVIRRVSSAEGNFDADGWLNIGVLGTQPRMGETYISTGSLYLCCTAFLPLGLPASDPFWSAPDEPWTQARIWQGDDTAVRHALGM